MNSSPPYPLVSTRWVRRISITSDAELLLAHRNGFVQSDSEMAALWTNADSRTLNLIVNSDSGSSGVLADKYFGLLLIYLYEQWFLLDMPRKALEYLVIDFRESDMIAVHDRMLPARIAGITERAENIGKISLDNYRMNMKFHKWLGDYVGAVLSNDLLKRSLY